MEFRLDEVPSYRDTVTDFKVITHDNEVLFEIGGCCEDAPALLSLTQVEELRDFLTTILDSRK